MTQRPTTVQHQAPFDPETLGEAGQGESRWVAWLVVLACLLVVLLGLGALVRVQFSHTAGVLLQLAGLLLADAWLLYGLWQWRKKVWPLRVFWWVLSGTLVLALSVGALVLHWDMIAISLVGLWSMALAFFGGLQLIRHLPELAFALLPVVAMLIASRAAGYGFSTSMQVLAAHLVVAGLVYFGARSVPRALLIGACVMSLLLVLRTMVFMFNVDHALPILQMFRFDRMPGLMLSVIGAGVVSAALLGTPRTVLAVARTLIDEVAHMRIGIVIIALLLSVVVVFPLILDSSERLTYRVQFFLTYTIWPTSALLTLLSILVCCWTVSSDLTRKQIFMTMVKPIRRSEYLLGKWMGMMAINLLLVVVAGAGIYAFTYVMKNTGASRFEMSKLENEVLIARRGVVPVPPNDPDFSRALSQRVHELQGANTARDGYEVDTNSQLNVMRTRFQTLLPSESVDFLFRGLSPAKRYGDRIQLSFSPRVTGKTESKTASMFVWVNGQPFNVTQDGVHEPIEAASRVSQVIMLNSSDIDSQGNVLIRMASAMKVDEGPLATQLPPKIVFSADGGIEMLYRVESFGMNLIHALSIIWVKLMFIAAFALAAGSFLSFPVASVLCFMVFVTASLSGFLQSSFNQYGVVHTDGTLWSEIAAPFAEIFNLAFQEGKIWDAAKIVVTYVGRFFVAIMPSFSEYNPVPKMAHGRDVGANSVMKALLNVGFLWSLIVGLVGLAIFSRRELARVTV